MLDHGAMKIVLAALALLALVATAAAGQSPHRTPPRRCRTTPTLEAAGARFGNDHDPQHANLRCRTDPRENHGTVPPGQPTASAHARRRRPGRSCCSAVASRYQGRLLAGNRTQPAAAGIPARTTRAARGLARRRGRYPGRDARRLDAADRPELRTQRRQATTASLEVKDINLFGYGKTLAGRLQQGVDRKSTYFEWQDPAVFGSHWKDALHWANNSDGHDRSLQVYRPFYSLDVRHGGGLTVDRRRGHGHALSAGHRIRSLPARAAPVRCPGRLVAGPALGPHVCA